MCPVLIRRNPEICAAELDDEICLFHPQTAQYLNLNVTGSAIWNLLEAPSNREGLLAQLLVHFEVEEASCRRETEAFLAEALALGLLLEDPASA